MSRAVRITVGSVLVGVLAFVALVAGTMSAAAGWDGQLPGLSDLGAAGVDTPATAEVLDVDDYGDGWPTVDVRFTTPDGETVVTYVDWEWSEDLPRTGDDVDVLYDDLDPEYAFAADDPWLQDGAGEVEDEQVPVEGGVTAEVAGWVALAALLGVVVGTVVTVVAAVRAPAPRRETRAAGPYEAPHPSAPQPSAPQPSAPQPSAQHPYESRPAYVPPHPDAPAPQHPGPAGGRWSSPG